MVLGSYRKTTSVVQGAGRGGIYKCVLQVQVSIKRQRRHAEGGGMGTKQVSGRRRPREPTNVAGWRRP